jgi:hypothetical protein
MKTMKTKQAGVERYRPVFTQIGFIIALGISLMAFEWKTYEKGAIILVGASPIFEMKSSRQLQCNPNHHRHPFQLPGLY